MIHSPPIRPPLLAVPETGTDPNNREQDQAGTGAPKLAYHDDGFILDFVTPERAQRLIAAGSARPIIRRGKITRLVAITRARHLNTLNAAPTFIKGSFEDRGEHNMRVCRGYRVGGGR